jgi:GMP synthase (glutamine-hydrolysing)
VVVTGSSAMVSERLEWSERTGAWLVEVLRSGTPVLGLCYGHQLLVQALGGRVGPNPNGREMGTVEVRFSDDARDDPLLGAVPSRAPFQATHLESVLSLPEGVRGLAGTSLDPHSAFAVSPRPGEPVRAWGVQFHPEFDAVVMRAYLTHRREILADEGFDPDALLAAVQETPEGPSLLRRFAALVLRDAGSG